MGRDAYAIDDKKTIIFWSRKAANTSLAAWLIENRKISSDSGRGRIKRSFIKTGCGKLHVDPQAALRLIQDEGYEDYILARDPFRRAVSAYVEKFIYYGTTPLDNLDVLKPFARKALQEAMAMHGPASGKYTGLSFSQFLEYIATKVGTSSKHGEPPLNGHWNTQVPFFFSGRFTYTNIIRIESIERDIQPLARKLDCEHPFPHARKNVVPARMENDLDLSETPSVELIRAGVVPGPQALLNTRTRELIKQAYEIDFRMLGYEPETTDKPTNPNKEILRVTTDDSHPLEPEQKKKKDKSKIAATPESFAATINAMNRFLHLLAASPLFQAPNLGLSEWSVLSELERKMLPSKKLEKHFGITREQRKQLLEKLQTLGCITIKEKTTVVTLTDEGKKRLGLINDKIGPVLSGLKNKKGALQKTAKNLRGLSREMLEFKSQDRRIRRKQQKLDADS